MRYAIVAFLFAAVAFAREPKIGPYIYSTGGDGRVVHASGSWERIEPMLEKWTGSYFWIRHQGREYLIRDAATLAQIGKVFAPMYAVGAELEALHRKMRPLEQQERDIERRMDAIDDAEGDRPISEAERQRYRELREELRPLQARIRAFEAEEERIDDRHEAAEREAETKLIPLIEQAIRSGVAKPL